MLLRLSIIPFTIVALSGPAFSGEAPDMLGKWIGTVDSAIHAGTTPYRTAEPGKKITFAKEAMTFTLDIKEQQGARRAALQALGSGGGQQLDIAGTFN